MLIDDEAKTQSFLKHFPFQIQSLLLISLSHIAYVNEFSHVLSTHPEFVKLTVHVFKKD